MHITFYNSQLFLVETGTILLNYSRLSICQMFLLLETLLQLCFPVKCSYFLKPCCNYVFHFLLLSISKKAKDKCDFRKQIFCFYKFWLSLVLRRSYFIVNNQFVRCCSQFRKQHPLWKAGRGLFKTQLNIYHRAFFTKVSNGSKPLIIFEKNFHVICSTGF